MTGFVYDRFAGAVFGVAPRLLQSYQAQSAVNVDVRDGNIEPFGASTLQQTLPKAGTIETIWLWEGSDWFHWSTDVDVVDGPVPDDTEGRAYFTGDGEPKMTYAGLATSSGDGIYPSSWVRLGVPAPASAPSVTVSGTADDPDNDIEEDRSYVYTYVSNKGEEGPPSLPSQIVTWLPGQTVDLSSMDTGPTGNYNVQHKRIYRTATSGDTTNFQFVDEIGIANTSYNDSIATAQLGEIIPSITWDPPPDDMIGLTAMANGILVGFRANEILFSERYLPHAWPVGYRLQVEPDIVAIGAFATHLVVGTKDYPYLVTGTDPSAMAMQRLEIPWPCLSKRGMVEMGSAVVYPSTDGLVKVSGNGPELLTQGLLTPSQWRNLNPETIDAYRHDEYVAIYYNGINGLEGGLYPLTGDWLMKITGTGTAGFTDPADGTLYLVFNDDELYAVNQGGALNAEWHSREEVFPRPINLGAARVDAESYPLTFELYADGTLKASISVSDDRAFMLPAGYLSTRYSVKVLTDKAVRRIECAEFAMELGQL